MFNQSVFDTSKKIESIPQDVDVVFVSDLFSSDHIGGAELTTDALIDESHLNIFRLRSSDVNMELLSNSSSKFWIFGNFSGMASDLIPSIIANINYAIIEFDYKYCKYRSPEKHRIAEKKRCNCHNEMNGKMISAFYHGAESLWWMSKNQMDKYHELFPFLSDKKNTVLSSIFDNSFFEKISELRVKNKNKTKERWSIVGSTSWIKGVEDAEAFCKSNKFDYDVLWNLSYENMLESLSMSKGIVFLPRGMDTCPRFVIEAKLLGCDLIINTNVQHAKEKWFDTDNFDDIQSYLKNRPKIFWNEIQKSFNNNSTISGYTTTLNCIDQDYPFEESIMSLFGFCDQVVVVDGGSIDGTWERLQELSRDNRQLLIHQQSRDWNHPRFAVFDGLQKALARALCTSGFCWQQDSDEIVHEDDYDKIKNLINEIPKNVDIIALPVIEYWGGKDKIRIDVNPWKWRLSRNKPHITHGIPRELRKFDKKGEIFSLPGTDGCDYIRSDTFDRVDFANFYDETGHNMRIKALSGDSESLTAYQQWLDNVLKILPAVHHYSWFDIERKIKTYKTYWSTHWQSLYDIKQEDTVENNMFFDKTWKDVTDDDIKSLADRLKTEMGGWIFHEKLDFSKQTPSIDGTSSHPEIMNNRVD